MLLAKGAEEEIVLPKWLSNQMMRAFLKRDRRQIRLLNDCWFFYYNRREADIESGKTE